MCRGTTLANVAILFTSNTTVRLALWLARAKSFPVISFHGSGKAAKVLQLLHCLVIREDQSVFPEPLGSDILLHKSQGAFPSPQHLQSILLQYGDTGLNPIKYDKDNRH